MSHWPDRRILDLFGIDLPIIQAPMAGLGTPEMALAVAEAGGLASLALATLTIEQGREAFFAFKQRSTKPINVNFFSYRPVVPNSERLNLWRQRLRPYYEELGLDLEAPVEDRPPFAPFGEVHCCFIEELKPEIVSFHFGLPEPGLLNRVLATGAKILSSATAVQEALWLEARGCHAIIAQGLEAGGHRGMFLSDDLATQIGTMALVPQIAEAVKVPVIAAGGIADGRGIAAAFALGASAVQIGTAYLLCPEANAAPAYRGALRAARNDTTVLTNVFTGRPARVVSTRIVDELGAISESVPEFPFASIALAPLRAASELTGSTDFSPVWAGQAAPLGRELPAAELTRRLAIETLATLARGLDAARES